MTTDSITLDGQFLPEEPSHPEGARFFTELSGMLDGKPKEPGTVEAALSAWEDLLEKIGSELYHMASMLLGEGEETVALIEDVVTNLDLAACSTHLEARHNARLTLAAKAIAILHQRNASSLAAPVEDSTGSSPVTCIEDDDLDSVGVSPAELEQMISGPERHRLRDWLEGLTSSLRVIFVLRAVAALSSAEVAGVLAENASPEAENWTPDAVRTTFRQGLCSLASQLIHASASR